VREWNDCPNRFQAGAIGTIALLWLY